MKTLIKFDELISKYYDNEMGQSERMEYEARLALHKSIKEYNNDGCFAYYKISNSIRQVKYRAKYKAQRVIRKAARKNEVELINSNTVFLKGFNKFLGNFFLNVNRNNAQKFNRF